MRVMAGLSALVLLMALLAGCGDSGKETLVFSGNEQVVESSDPTAPTDADAPQPAKVGKGLLVGLVVDDLIHPIKGASVKLPGFDFKDVTDRNGGFAFTNLPTGEYFVTANATGYYGAEATISVSADEVAKVKFVLKPIPPPDPYHVTQVFEGFADVTDSDLFSLGLFCSTCAFDVYLGGPGFRGITMEATMEAYVGTGGGQNTFGWELSESYSYNSDYGNGLNPMHILLHAGDTNETTALQPGETAYRLTVTPASFPAPEVNKRFQVYVTSWFNQDIPIAWSFVNGDT